MGVDNVAGDYCCGDNQESDESAERAKFCYLGGFEKPKKLSKKCQRSYAEEEIPWRSFEGNWVNADEVKNGTQVGNIYQSMEPLPPFVSEFIHGPIRGGERHGKKNTKTN